MKKRLISFMLLITVISCVGFNTDYFKNLLTLISQAAKEVIYEETERYDEETTDSAVDSLEQELEKLDVRNFFEDESETESGSNPKNVFPENPDDLLPEIPRNKATKANGTTSQTIQTSDNIRIRAEQHPLLPSETYNPRHHGVHYHVEYKVDPTKSWNNKNNVKKWYPEGYTPGAGSGFIPGEPFPE